MVFQNGFCIKQKVQKNHSLKKEVIELINREYISIIQIYPTAPM